MRAAEYVKDDIDYPKIIEGKKTDYRLLRRIARIVCYGTIAVAAYLLTVVTVFMIAELIKS